MTVEAAIQEFSAITAARDREHETWRNRRCTSSVAEGERAG